MGKLPLIMYRCIFMFLLLCTSCVEQKDTTSIKIDLMATDSDTLYYSSFVDSLSYTLIPQHYYKIFFLST